MFIKDNVGIFIKVKASWAITLQVYIYKFILQMYLEVKNNNGHEILYVLFVAVRDPNKTKCPPKRTSSEVKYLWMVEYSKHKIL